MKYFLRTILMVLFIMLVSIVHATVNVDVLNSNQSNLKLKITSNDFQIGEKKLADGELYSKITPSLGQLLPGQPDLPQIIRWIAIPSGGKVDVSYTINSEKINTNINIAPVQKALQDRANAPKPDFKKDNGIYNQDAFFPQEQVKIEKRFFKNGQEYALLKISPFQYNPKSQILKFNSEIDIEINFIGGRISGKVSNVAVLNKNIFSSEREDRNYLAEMMIITDTQFVESVENLAKWKRKLGIKTNIFTTQEIGDTANEIEEFIDSYCEEAETIPTYLLLFGDAEYIPTHYKTVHPYTDGNQGYTAADIYYADFEDDMLTDMAFGRIPVDTVAEADSIISRIIRYEKNPPAETSFYENAIAAAYFQEQDSGNGMAERRFAKTSEDFRNFLIEEEDYDVERIYITDYSTEPLYWNDSSYVFENDTPGGDLPEELKKPFFPWDGNASDIINSVNEGKFLLMHRDHGYRQGWGDPAFNNNNVNNINNNFKTPIVWTINCETAWFDNETDDPSCGTSNDAESFTEAWLRHETGGSVGLIGATRVSYSGNNDRLVWGLLDAIWPGFLEWAQADYPENEPIYRMGDVMNYAKEYLLTSYSWGDDILTTSLEEFSYFGDPTMRIYTEQPEIITASHVPLVPFGTEEIVVETNMDDALVTLVYDNEIVGMAYSENGQAILQVDGLESEGIAEITISKHNCVPYISEIMVEAVGAYIVAELNNITENGEYIDGSIQSLDLLNFDLKLNNIGSEVSQNLELTLNCESEFVEILNNQAATESAALNEDIIVENAFQVELLEGIADSTYIPFEVIISDGENQWNNEFSVFVHAANLKYQDYSLEFDGDIFSPGETASLFFDIKNVGSGFAYEINSVLVSDNELVTFDGLDVIDFLAPDDVAETSQALNITLAEVFPIDSLLTVQLQMIDIAELSFQNPLYILIGVKGYDLENEPNWNHESITESYGDQWHLSDQDNVTPLGNYSYKFGDIGDGNYETLQHGALYIPEVELEAGAFLRFWHKMNAGHQINEISWDGGIVEISVDGSDFEQIYPIGGYPNILLNLPTSPFDVDTEFYSGFFDWEEAEFDLSEFQGNAIIRFVFGSANMQTSLGWFIDDIRIGSNGEISDAVDDMVELPLEISNYPNPFNIASNRSASTNIRFSVPNIDDDKAVISIYNLKGQLVKEITIKIQANKSSFYQVAWNGDDTNDNKVSSGIYFYRLKVGEYSAYNKMMLIK